MAIQIENQVSDEKQCGHQDGKVTVPHEDFLSKVNAVRYAFLELGIKNGIIVARTDSLGAGLTQKVPYLLYLFSSRQLSLCRNDNQAFFHVKWI